MNAGELVSVTPVKRVVRKNSDDEPIFLFDCLAIDNCAQNYRGASPSLRAPLHLDLTPLTYISHDCLLYLAALVRWRTLRDQTTYLSLPESDKCVDYLRSWKFPDLIANISGRDFEACLTQTSLNLYRTQRRDLPTRVEVIRTPSGGLEELLPKSHFAITPITLRGSPFQSASIEMNRWLEDHVAAVLNRYLDNQGQRIATHVVLEAVLNAASHPKASMAYTSSQFIREDYVLDALERGPYLEIAIWDDGDPIAYTLQQAIHDGREVKSAAYGFVEEKFTVKLVRTATGQPEIRILSTGNPGIDYNFPWLTVSAFLAGITSRPRTQGANDTSKPAIEGIEEELPAEFWDRGGLGLYLIRKNIIDLFKGRIRYMCQNYRMSMSSGGDRGIYDVLIQHRPDNSWPLRGNLMILEIPLG